MFIAFIDNLDIHLPQIELFSTRTVYVVYKNCITFDYQMKGSGDASSDSVDCSLTRKRVRTACRCRVVTDPLLRHLPNALPLLRKDARSHRLIWNAPPWWSDPRWGRLYLQVSRCTLKKSVSRKVCPLLGLKSVKLKSPKDPETSRKPGHDALKGQDSGARRACQGSEALWGAPWYLD